MTDPKRVALWLALACGGVAACATTSTTIEQSWRSPGSTVARPHNIAVVYMSQDGAIRRTAEDRMASQLWARGLRAVASYNVLADSQVAPNQRTAAKRSLAAAGFDGVLVMRLVGRDNADQYQSYGYNGSVVRVESNLYSLPDDKLVWSALSQTIDPSGAPMVIDETTTAVANQMQREGVTPAQRAATATAKR